MLAGMADAVNAAHTSPQVGQSRLMASKSGQISVQVAKNW